MEQPPIKKSRAEGPDNPSSMASRKLQSSVVSISKNGLTLRSLSATAPPTVSTAETDARIIASSAAATPPSTVSEEASLEDRLTSLELERAALDKKIAGLKGQIAARNPFMRALGIAPEAMLSFLDMTDANTLKLVSKLTREDVRRASWSVDLLGMLEDKRQWVADLRKWRHA
jgi:hypothetical protein